MASVRVIPAAGGIVWRKRPAGKRPEPRLEMLVEHRPSYDDWSFPKGKRDPGETLQQTAVREIAEETGVRVRLGHPLAELSYPVAAGLKTVTYWSAQPVGTPEPFVPNREVDEIRWVDAATARGLLTYEHDVELMDAFLELRERKAHRSRTLIVLRHGKAVSREEFAGDDDLARPLAAAGRAQADALVPVLAAYGVRRVVSSPALRCAQTVEPYAHSISTFLEIDDRLAEGTRAGQVQRAVEAVLDRKKPVVLCTHRPTLPAVFDVLGLESPALAPGEAIVVHHRKGVVHATEKLG
jgi:phosphohistidine phosphatase SixA/8-oxo-dGTP pyrophosphatase MutT (NUDIX family)